MNRERQLVLELAHSPSLARDDFLVSESNRGAWLALADEGSSGDGRIALSGPAGAGKTHLASIWGAGRGAVRLDAAGLTEAQVEALAGQRAVVVEDADRLCVLAERDRREAERLLFHVINLSAAHDIALLVTGRAPPARWAVETPDLASRLAAMPHVAIDPPDDALLSSIVDKLFSDRQLPVGAGTKEYVLARMERSFSAAQRIVGRLDRMALATRRPVTRSLAAKLYDAEPGIFDGTGEG